MNKLIALDAGHGKDTYPPSKGVPQMPEFEFNSKVVGYAKNLLEFHHFNVLLTQPLDGNEVSLQMRTDLAISRKVDLLISVHADYNDEPEPNGHWGFYWHTSNSSKSLAVIYNKHMQNNNPGMRNRGNMESKQGSFNHYMVRIPSTNPTHVFPAVLYEHGFMSNSQDLALLLSDSFRRSCAKAIAQTVCEYYGVQFREHSLPTANQELGSLGTATVDVDELRIRSGPSTDFAILGKIYKGNSFPVYEIRNGWYRIGAGKWISNQDNIYCTFSMQSSPAVIGNAVVNSQELNVRRNGNTEAPIVRQVTAGEVFEVYKVKNNWLKIGENEWISNTDEIFTTFNPF